MGVQRLQTYIIKNNIGNKISLVDVAKKEKEYKIIIDGDSVSFFLYENSQLPRIFGGEYHNLKTYIDMFFSKFLQAGISLTVVYDGIPPDEKRSTIQERRKTKCQKSIQLWQNIDKITDTNSIIPVTRPGLLRNVMIEVLNKYNIPIIHAENENDDLIVELAQDQHFDAILAKDTDFLIYNVKSYIPINQIDIDSVELNAQVISRNDICRHFKLQSKMLPLFAYLAGNDITHGNQKLTNMINKIHLQMQPNILLNLSKFIQFKMDKIMQLITDDTLFIEGLLLCYKKYNQLLCTTNTLKIMEPYKTYYSEMKLETEVAILIERGVRCFTGSFSGFHLCLPKKLLPWRKKIYGTLLDKDIVEFFWHMTPGYPESSPKWSKHIMEIDNQYKNSPKNIETLLQCLELSIHKLESIEPKYWLPTLAIILMTRVITLSKFDIQALVYHIFTIDKYTFKETDDICHNITSYDRFSLELTDCYLSCIQELLVYNQILLFPLKSDRISAIFSGQLFYCLHKKLIDFKDNDKVANNIIRIILE